MNPIGQAIAYAGDASAYHLHVTLTNGQTLVGVTFSDSSDKCTIGVEDAEGCRYVHFINPDHIVHVRLEWL